MSRAPDYLARHGMSRDLPPHVLGPARLLRALLRNGLDVEAIPHALRLIVEIERLAVEGREGREEVAA